MPSCYASYPAHLSSLVTYSYLQVALSNEKVLKQRDQKKQKPLEVMPRPGLNCVGTTTNLFISGHQ